MPEDTQTVVDAPSAPAEESFEIELPEGEVGQEFLRVAEATEEPATEPVSSTSKAAKPAEPDKTGNITAALHEEREKRRKLSRENQSLKRDAERWKRIEDEETRARELMAGRRAAAIEVRPDSTRVATAANAADDMGKAAVVSVEEAARMVNEAVVKLKRERVLEQEDDMRDQCDDYDAVVKQAGFFEATQIVRLPDGTQSYANPRIAAEIYGSTNPPRTAYRLAKAKLAAAQEPVPVATEDDVETDPQPETKPIATSPRPAAATRAVAPAPPTEEALAEAEARGERRAVARVLDNAIKPRGLRVIRDAGKPTRIQLTSGYLDDLYERDPHAWERIVKSDPVLQRRYFG